MRIDHLTPLTGRMLFAMPSVTERAFQRSAILVCAHSANGGMGLLVNRPATNMTLRRLLRETGRSVPEVRIGVPVHAGGPADIDRAFVLHSPDYHLAAHTIRVTEAIWLTPHDDVIDDLAQGYGPARSFIAMGYCGWGAGELEHEVREGCWLTGAANDDLVFDTPSADRWPRGMERMGIAPSALSFQPGHA